MKTERWIWAAIMAGAALAGSAGYSAAASPGAAAVRGAVFPASVLRESVSASVLQETVPAAETASSPAQDALYVTVRAEGLAAQEKLRVFSGEDQLDLAALDAQHEALLELPPGENYTVHADSGLAAGFTLAENAAITNVTGDGWTDGEILYLTPDPKGTLTVTASVPDGVILTVSLQGGETDEQRSLSAETGGKAVFAGLTPGSYTLTANGKERKVTLTREMPDVTVGLD